MDPARQSAHPDQTSSLTPEDKLRSSSSVKGTILGQFRWVICAVLFLGITKNYMDRQVLAVLKTNLQHQFGWSEIDYGNLVFAFHTAYALGMLVVGRMIDRLGTRIGYAVTIAFWSLASMAHGLMTSIDGFLAARFVLGFGEAGVFPASLKAVAEWFPKKERALATGLCNAGTNVGAALTPLVVSWIFVRWGWRGCFFAVGAMGFVGLALWLWLYRRPEQHPQCSTKELEYIRSDLAESAGKVGLSEIIWRRQTWAFVSGKFLIDPIWCFYLFWIPDFLERKHGLQLPTQIPLRSTNAASSCCVDVRKILPGCRRRTKKLIHSHPACSRVRFNSSPDCSDGKSRERIRKLLSLISPPRETDLPGSFSAP